MGASLKMTNKLIHADSLNLLALRNCELFIQVPPAFNYAIIVTSDLIWSLSQGTLQKKEKKSRTWFCFCALNKGSMQHVLRVAMQAYTHNELERWQQMGLPQHNLEKFPNSYYIKMGILGVALEVISLQHFITITMLAC